jgi:hypothetical protein
MNYSTFILNKKIVYIRNDEGLYSVVIAISWIAKKGADCLPGRYALRLQALLAHKK